MQIKELYRYERANGGVTVSLTPPDSPDTSYTTIYRVIATEGKSITKDGLNLYPVIDTDEKDGWYEVETPPSKEDEQSDDLEKQSNIITAIRNEPMLAGLITAQINTLSVDDNVALRWKPLYPVWQTDTSYQIGDKEQWLGELYRCLQPHVSQSEWSPDKIPALWTEIDETHEGTEADPIPYNNNMILENGKYYMQDNVMYRCIRDSINPLYNPLSELVGIYVEIVSDFKGA